MKPALIARWWTVAYAAMLIAALSAFILSTGTLPTVQNTLGTFWKSQVIESLGNQSRLWDLMLIPYFWYYIKMVLSQTEPSTEARSKAVDTFVVLVTLFTFTGIFITALIVLVILIYMVVFTRKNN